MLIIRKEQMEVFEEAALQDFEDEMVEHIKQFTPKQSEVIGEDNVRQVVRMGMEKAEAYSFTKQGPVRFYIDMMFMLGSDFDTDPQYPWTSEILNDPSIGDQMHRADRLHNKMMDYLSKVVGPKHEYEKEALRRLSQLRIEDLTIAEENFENDMIIQFGRIYSRKCEYIGEAALRNLIQECYLQLTNYYVSHSSAPAVYSLLMFAFGHGCFSDPRFPWIENILEDDDLDDENKIEFLYRQMKEHIKSDEDIIINQGKGYSLT